MAEQVRQSIVSKLRQAVWDGRASDLRRLLKKATVSEVNFVDQNYLQGASILSISAHNGRFDIAKHLIGAKAVVGQAMNNGATPLAISAQKGHFDIAKYLIGAKAAVDQVMNDGSTPLHVSAHQGHFDIAKCLIGAKAAVNLAAIDGATPIYISARQGHSDILKYLVGVKAAVNPAMNDGNTPLHTSARKGHFDIVKTLIQHGADPTLEWQHGGQGYTAQQIATMSNHPEVAAHLEEATRATTNLSPLHRECFRRYTDHLHALFRSDAVTSAMLEQPAPPGGTPVEIAEASGIRDTTIELLPVCERTL